MVRTGLIGLMCLGAAPPLALEQGPPRKATQVLAPGPTSARTASSASSEEPGDPDAPVAGVIRGGVDVMPAPGLIHDGTAVQTGRMGWADIHLLGHGRLRLFARSEVRVGRGEIRLIEGRAWLQVHRPTVLVVRGGPGRLSAGTSVILEDTRSGGLVVAVRSGQASVGSVLVARGQVWRRPLLGPAGPPRRGGDQLAELLRSRSTAARSSSPGRKLGDFSGVEAWLQEELQKATVGAPRGLAVGRIVRSEQEAAGTGPGGVLPEAAFRPPPFFEDEIPPRGPNVRIEVDFSED